MFHDFDSLYLSPTVDTRHKYIGTSSLMLIDITSNAFGFANCESFTLDWLEMADLIVVLDIDVGEDCVASKGLVVALELHVF